MDISEKQKIASIARTLIREFELCEDEEFVELVLECVVTVDSMPIKVERL